MFCAIMQPTYFPWIGYFDLVDRVDKFVFLNDVKLEKSDWHVRNRIKTADGEVYLTVPVRLKDGRMNTNINTAEINSQKPWQKKHLRAVSYAYRKAPFYDEVYPIMEELLSVPKQYLDEQNIHIIKTICGRLGIGTEFYISSQLEGIEGKKDERLVHICRSLNCQRYLSPQGSAVYLEREVPGGQLTLNAIELFYQNFEHPEYSQLYGDFISHLSVIDVLFNCGFEGALEVIRRGQRNAFDYMTFRKEILNVT